MMKLKTLDIAVMAAQDFINRVEKLKENGETYQFYQGDKRSFCGGKDTAAVKRASMDLTRALADLRRTGDR